LFQNQPNPFSSTTVIKYYIPETSGPAQIIISDMTGSKELMRVNLVNLGFGQITINAGTFAAGTYTYTLIVNNQQIDTKKMILVGQ
jgi:hypothetical protein